MPTSNSYQPPTTNEATSERPTGYIPSTHAVDRFEEQLAFARARALEDHHQVLVLLMKLHPKDEDRTFPPTLTTPVTKQGLTALTKRLPGSFFSMVGSGNVVGFAPNVVDETTVSQILDIIDSAFAEPIEIAGTPHHLKLKVGLSLIGNTHQDIGDALEQVRIALAETTDTTPVVRFTPDLSRQGRDDPTYVSRLKIALEEKSLDVVFQPILSLEQNGIIGVEALARWHDSELGDVIPAQFLSIAERSGMIHQLGEQVLTKAVEIAAGWVQQNIFADVTLWVNFSPTEIAHAGFEPMVLGLIEKYPGIKLGLELADSSVVEQQIVSKTLSRLRLAGIRTSIDDFSSADTAISRLRNLPFDNVKLAREFVQRLPSSTEDQAIVELLTEIGNQSGFTTSASGIETEEQLHLLTRLGVQAAQGYLLARPANAQEMSALLTAAVLVR